MAYLNVVEVESALEALALEYQNLCSLITLPHRTPEGRTSHALRLGNEGTPKYKGILFTGCQHGREWGGAEICVYFAADLLEAYTGNAGLQYGDKAFSAAEVRRIINDMDVFVFPCVNPDGRHFDQTDPKTVKQGGGWRKNRNPAYAGGSSNPACVGVDLNRNYDYLWDFQKHFDPSIINNPNPRNRRPPASADPCNFQVYHGPEPHSEPESKNVVWLLDTFPQIQWFMDIHCYTGTVLHPWGDAPNQTRNSTMNFLNPAYDGKRGVDNVQQYGEYIYWLDLHKFEELAKDVRDAIKAVRNQQYLTWQSYYLQVAGGNNTFYPTSGTVDDYAYSRHKVDGTKPKVYGFTIEFGLEPDFHPTWSEMEQIVLDIDAGLVEFCLKAGKSVFATPPPRPDYQIDTPDLVAEILFGIINDAGGAIIIGGKPRPVPPWDPMMRDILTGLLIYQLSSHLTGPMRQTLQLQALRLIEHVAEVTAAKLEQLE